MSIVTPFEICFVGGTEDSYTAASLEPDVEVKVNPLYLINKFIDFYFFSDMLLNFNTGYFNYKVSQGCHKPRLPPPRLRPRVPPTHLILAFCRRAFGW